MTFSDRVKLSNEYRAWLIEENEKHFYSIVSSPETFLAFLEIKGYKILKQDYSHDCSECLLYQLAKKKFNESKEENNERK